jgi:hypothetical protein
MNKFQREVQKRTKMTLRFVALGDMTYRAFVGLVKIQLKKDIKSNQVKL